MNSCLIQNIDIYTDGKIKTNQNILIEGSKISKIGSNIICPDANKFDGKGMLGLPGLVNSHTHVAMTLFRSYADDVALMDWLQKHIWPAEEKLTTDLVYWGSQLAFAEMIRGGTTAFCDMYFFMDAVGESAVSAGIRGVLSRGLAGASPTANESLSEGIELFQNWHNTHDGLIHVMLGPHAPYTCPNKFLEKVIEAAKRKQIEIHIHLSETKDEVKKCLEIHGLTPIELMNKIGLFDLPTLAAHCVHVTENDLAIMAEKHVRVAHNPRSNLKLASGIAPLLDMKKHGIIVGLATDGASSNNKLDMFEEMQYAAQIHKGINLDPFAITATDAVELATFGGAQSIGFSNLGKIEEGYLADIILIDRSGFHWQPSYNDVSSLAYAANSMDVDSVWINGKLVMKNKELLTIDTERVFYEINRAKNFFSYCKNT